LQERAAGEIHDTYLTENRPVKLVFSLGDIKPGIILIFFTNENFIHLFRYYWIPKPEPEIREIK
jgi:hypothetical protein